MVQYRQCLCPLIDAVHVGRSWRLSICFGKRRYSRETSSREKNKSLVILSTSTDVYENLAMEDFLFRTLPIKESSNTEYKRLFFYSNAPAVVFGRNQNPWRECNLPLISLINKNRRGLQEQSGYVSLGEGDECLPIRVLRRLSGGGTVFHDSGNVNFSILTSRQDFTRDRHTVAFVEALNKLEQLNRKLLVNERHDIVDIEGNKVSGSAFKIERNRAYHHATFLLSSQLKTLGRVLRRDESTLGQIEGSGVESTRSPVTNVGLTHDTFIATVTQAFKDLYHHEGCKTDVEKNFQVITISPKTFAKSISYIYEIGHGETELSQQETEKTLKEKISELRSWDWNFARTPKFKHILSVPVDVTGVTNHEAGQLVISIQDGVVHNIQASDNIPLNVQASLESLVGCDYRGQDLAKEILSSDAEAKPLSEWILNVTDGGYGI